MIEQNSTLVLDEQTVQSVIDSIDILQESCVHCRFWRLASRVAVDGQNNILIGGHCTRRAPTHDPMAGTTFPVTDFNLRACGDFERSFRVYEVKHLLQGYVNEDYQGIRINDYGSSRSD